MRILTVVFLGCLATTLSTDASAQSSLGISGAEFSAGLNGMPGGDGYAFGHFRLGVDLTEHHGFQGDFALTQGDPGDIGTLAAHLNMTPLEAQKYGLFAAISDMDSRALAYASLGAEGMLTLDDRTLLEGHAGIGWARWDEMDADFAGTALAGLDGLDYVFAGAGLVRQVSATTRIEGFVSATHLDESTFHGTAYEAELRAVLAPANSPWSAHATLTRTGLSGHADGARTSLGIGLTLSLGRAGGATPRTRAFRTPDPLSPLFHAVMD